MTALEFAAKLRQTADWCEAHPEAKVPHGETTLDLFLSYDPKVRAKEIKALGNVTKVMERNYVVLRPIGADLFTYNISRDEVCTARVVGTEHVPERIIPAYERDIVEWDCSEASLLKPKQSEGQE